MLEITKYQICAKVEKNCCKSTDQRKEKTTW